MAITPVKIVLFLAGGTVAAGGTAYFAGLFDNALVSPPAAEAPAPSPPKMAALPPSENQAASKQASGQTPEPQAGTSADQPSAKGGAAEGAGEPKVEVPSFDIVRVEPGGSIVIAGHAAANAKVEAVIGSRIIGSAVAGPEGDFAIVLEKPLEPGDYSIVLRSTTPDNVVAMSTETAVVAIPDTAAGQVLALVEEPGKPSQLITLPEPKGKSADATTKPGGDAENPSGTAASDSDAGPADLESAAGSAQATAEAGTQAETASQEKTGRLGQQDIASAPDHTADKSAASPAASGNSEAAGPGTETKQAEGQELASAGEQAKPKLTTQPSANDGPKVAVEAVEIEGRKIFVAGSATPGLYLRAYANEILLGDSPASKGGRFLIETERDLPVGDYIIRVDALGSDGVKVLARAAVPFEREAGEKVAAVAPAQSPDQASQGGSAASSEGGLGSGSSPAESQTAAGKSDRPARNSQNGVVASAGAESKAGTDDYRSSSDAGAPMVAPARSREQQPADHAGSVSGSDTAPPAEVAAAGEMMQPGSVLAPKLQSVDGSVIIRRGDSLWRISRRVYGRGVRYSTIYLANQNQIADPDRIYPGQVFSVPSKTEKGEQADMTTLGEQAVQPPVLAQ